MGKKGQGGGQNQDDSNPSAGDFPAVTPRDLYPTSDIRFVLVELGKISAKLEHLTDEAKKHTEKFEEIGEKIHGLQKVLHGFYVAGAVIAVVAIGFWYLEGDRIMAVLKPAVPAAALAPADLAVSPTSAPPANGAANTP